MSLIFLLSRFHIIFISVSVAEWLPLGISAHSVELCCLVLLCVIDISQFGFEGWILFLVVSVPDLRIFFTLEYTAVLLK